MPTCAEPIHRPDRRTVDSSNHSARLKAQMLRAAVQDNADTIAGRVPSSLRPARRVLAGWARQAWLLVLPFSIILGLALVASRSMAAVEAARSARIPVVATQFAPSIGPVPASIPDMSLLT